jgi:hypothetical protein
VAFWRRKQGNDENASAGAVVLGQQLADATKAEKRHRRRRRGRPSPLAGVAYDAATGASHLHRWVESDVDDAVSRLASTFAVMTREDATQARATLTMDDFYTLLAFGRRSVVASLHGHEEPSLRQGLAAVSAVDLERVDWRDALAAAELIAWAMARKGIDHAAELDELEPIQDQAMRQALQPLAERPAGELTPGPWRCVDSGAGPVLAWDEFGRFAPTVDLMGVALAVGSVVEADVYRISSISVGGELPDVWLMPSEEHDMERALRAIRACVTVSAQLVPTEARHAEDQQLTAFVAEVETSGDAAMLAAAAVPTKSYEALGVPHQTLCCVLVARSFVIGVRAHERPGALSRFADPIAHALRRA